MSQNSEVKYGAQVDLMFCFEQENIPPFSEVCRQDSEIKSASSVSQTFLR